MLSAVLRTIRGHDLIRPGEHVLVAVSGGPDSTALLHALVRLAPRLGCTLAAATVDHGLRPEAAREAVAVVETCRRLGVACESVRVDVRAARGKHVSWQDAARRARLGALEAIALRLDCARVALGHTADDQAETVLFRIVRGTGVAGLAGIPYRRDRFVRPLLDVRRREILRFLARRGATFVEDPSNADSRFARPRVRHAWIPMLERENPRLVEALLSLAAEVRGIAPRESPAIAGTPLGAPAGTRVSVAIDRRAADTVRRLVREAAGTRLVSVRGGTIEIAYGRASWLATAGAGNAVGRAASGGTGVRPTADAAREVPVTGGGIYRPDGDPTGPAIEIREGAGTRGPAKGVVAFDPASLGGTLLVRTRRPGDRMRPRGGRGSCKLSDLLIDRKVPRAERGRLPVLATASGEVLFVPGLRPSERGRPGPGTRKWLEVRAIPGAARPPGRPMPVAAV